MKIKSFFPIIESIKSYKAKDWRKDLIAGITVAVMLVPQGMAYASLAGVPLIYGLYSGLIPLVLYAILGTSRQMSIGPVAISALLVLAGVSQIAEPLSPEYISYVILVGLMIGVVQVLLGFCRLGFLVNFISHPVIIGFTSAAAIIIAISQLKDLLGMVIPRFPHAYETVQYVGQHLSEINWNAVAMCLGSIIIMVVLKKISKAIPYALIVVVVGTLLVFLVGEQTMGLDLVKEVPNGLPAFQMPQITWSNMKILIPTVFTVTVIGIVESIGIAKVIQSKHRNYKIRPNQELFALGFAKIGGAFFQSIPTSGSFTRSAVNNESGAKSGMASIFAAIMVALTLLFLTPLFYFLPKAVLAGIILLSVKSLFEFGEAKHLWKTDRIDFFMMAITFIVTLILGIEEGVMAGVLLSIAMVLYKSSRPHFVVLGRLPNTTIFRNINRYKGAEQMDGIMVVRFDNQLYFANAVYFREKIEDLVVTNKTVPELLILDASTIYGMDSTGVHALEEVYEFLSDKNIKFYISGMMGPARDRITKAGVISKIGKKSYFLNIDQAISHFTSLKSGVEKDWSADAIQSNIEEVDDHR